jgi:hypothetical protein
MADARQGSAGAWPAWVRIVISAALALHIMAVLAAELAERPSSPLEQGLADLFARYYELTHQGHSHRFYIDVPPTPVVTARLRFADGRPERTVRLPDRAARPRLRFQRQLALANYLSEDFRMARAAPDGEQESHWARSYARHLCRTNPGCSGVTLRVQMHLVPEFGQLLEAAARPGGKPMDVDAEEFYTLPERIGDFPCDPN